MLNLDFKHNPALKYFILISFGILFQRYCNLNPSILLGGLSLLFFLILFTSKKYTYIFLYFIIFISGAILFYNHSSNKYLSGLLGNSISEIEATGALLNQPIYKNNKLFFTINCDSILYKNYSIAINKKINIALSDTTLRLTQVLNPHDQVSIRGRINFLADPINPFFPDFRDYYFKENILGNIFLTKAENIFLIKKGELNFFDKLIFYAKETVNKFCAEMVRNEEGDLMNGLLTGNKTDIDDETIQNFKQTGLSHILAVSGQQATIIAFVLFTILSWFFNRKYQIITLAFLLFLYLFITGFQASIIRAEVMIIVFLTTRLFSRKIEPLNLLFFSGLIIICFTPQALFDAGFQLSYSALLGIIIFYSPIVEQANERVKLFKNNAVIRNIFQSIVLTISASIFTIPLTLFHFGFMSLMSLASNVFAVALSSIALCSGLAGVLFYNVLPIFSKLFGGFSYLILKLVIFISTTLAKIKFLNINIFQFSAYSAIALFVIGIYVMYSNKISTLLLRFLSFCLALFIIIFIEKSFSLENSVTNSVAIFSNKKINIPVIFSEDTALLFTPKSNSFDSIFICNVKKNIETNTNKTVILCGLEGYSNYFSKLKNNDFILKSNPVIITENSNLSFEIVDFMGINILQVPIKNPLQSCLILKPKNNFWEIIDWKKL